jgi:septum formation protein
MRLVLASASPRRAALLRAAGYEFDVLTVDLDERLHDGEAAAMYVRRLAAEKSAAAMAIMTRGPADHLRQGYGGPPKLYAEAEAGELPGAADSAGPTTSAEATLDRRSVTRRPKSGATTAVVLGADTAVVVDAEILGKPRDDRDAERMLRLLSGRTHAVLTGISLRRGAYELGRVISTSVQFAPLSSGDISWYLSSGEGRDKAGAYAIQGLASRFVTSIDGSYANVVGLPVATVHELLTDIASG